MFSLCFIWGCASDVSVVWEDYSEEALVEAKAQQQKVIVDVYAEWCVPCHELDKYTYTHLGVVEALEPFRRLKLDATRPEDPDVVKVIEDYDLEGVPTLFFLDEEGDEIPGTRINGFIEPGDFIDHIEQLDRS